MYARTVRKVTPIPARSGSTEKFIKFNEHYFEIELLEFDLQKSWARSRKCFGDCPSRGNLGAKDN